MQNKNRGISHYVIYIESFFPFMYVLYYTIQRAAERNFEVEYDMAAHILRDPNTGTLTPRRQTKWRKVLIHTLSNKVLRFAEVLFICGLSVWGSISSSLCNANCDFIFGFGYRYSAAITFH